MNIVIMTKGEWQAFGLVVEVCRQMGPSDRLLVWDDFSPEDWVEQMRKIAYVKQDALANNFGEHRNRVKAEFPAEEWILMLDADEWIQPCSIVSIHAKTLENPNSDAMFLERRNTFWDDTGSVVPPEIDYSKPFKPDFQGRMFKNLPDIRYQGHVHEGLTGHNWPLYLTGKPFTLIHHKERVNPRYAHLVKD